jgi:hypothetical protein
MAEMVGISCTAPRRNGAIGRLVAALQRGYARLTGGGERSSQLRLEDWPDYLLRDIGLDGSIRDQADLRGKPTDFLMR